MRQVLEAVMIFSLWFFASIALAAGEDKYFLCGPDEDGCPSYDYQTCVCVPTTDALEKKPHCLDLSHSRCYPFSKQTPCDRGDRYKDQGTCLAVLFQSEPEPPCLLKTRSFCVNHHIPFQE